MQKLLILYALISLIKAEIEIEQTPDQINYGIFSKDEIASVKALQLGDKRIILARYDGQGYLGTFTEKEGFSLKKSEFPYSVSAILLKHEDNFAIVDNSFLKEIGNKGRYISEYNIFDSNTLKKISSFTFKAQFPHDALNNFRIFQTDSTIIQLYIKNNTFCFTSTEFNLCTQEQTGKIGGLECVLLESNTSFLCLSSLQKGEGYNFWYKPYRNVASIIDLDLFSNNLTQKVLTDNDALLFSDLSGYAPYLAVSRSIQVKEGVYFFLFRYGGHTHFFLRIISYDKNKNNITVKEGWDGLCYSLIGYTNIPSSYSLISLNEGNFFFISSYRTSSETIMETISLNRTMRTIFEDNGPIYVDSLLNTNQEVEFFYANKDGLKFFKFDSNSSLLSKSTEYFVYINNITVFITESNSLREIVFLELPKEGKIYMIDEASGNKLVEKLVNYTKTAKFQYVSSSKPGNFSLKYRGKDKKKNEFIYNVLFHVFSCLEMCNSCLYGGTLEEHHCLDCADNYYQKEGENKKNCYKDPPGYYLSSAERVYKKCHESCKTCEKAPEGNIFNCDSCEDGLFYYKKEKKCLKKCPSSLIDMNGVCVKDCKISNQYSLFEKGSSSCIETLPLGYYAEKNEKYNIAKKCQFNCANSNNNDEEFKSFCRKRKKECSQKILVDEELRLNSFKIKDNTMQLLAYTEMSKRMKKETLNQAIGDISKAGKKINEDLLSNIHLMSQMLDVSDDLDNKDKQDMVERLIKELSKILTCEELEEFFKKEKDSAVLSTAISIYTLISNKKYISAQELSALTIIEKCVIQKGTPQFIGETNTDELNQEDFTMISGNAVKKMSSVLSEVTKNEDSIDPEQFNSSLRYQFNNSIISSSVRTGVKEVVESTSKMINQFHDDKSFTFGGTSFASAKLENLHEKNYIQNDIMITVSDCSNPTSNLEPLKKGKIKAKICIPFEALSINFEYGATVSIVDYAEYPLLNQNITSKVNKNFISIVMRNKKHEIIPVKDLNEPFHIVLKKPDKSLNECLFLNEEYYSLDNANCTSANIDDEYIECICNHLTDFSISSFNPVTLFKDIFRLFQQSRIINSFKPFKNLTYKNAYVLYTIGAILVIFSILLIFTLRYDLNKGSFFVIIVKKRKKCCSSKDEVSEEIDELEKKYRGTAEDSQRVIELSNLSTQKASKIEKKNTISNSLDIDSNKGNQKLIEKKKKESSCLCEYINEYWFLFKDFFLEEFWFCCIFLEFESELTKTNFLVIFIVKFISTLSIATIFTECGEPEEVAASYTNRDLAVAVITILINEIPFIIFELMLSRTQLPHHKSSLFYSYRMNAIYRYVFVYTIFILIIIFGTLNTTWVSLDSETNGLNCRFMTDFFLTIAIDCFIYQTLQLIFKALIYFFILNGEKSSCLRGTLLFVVALVPWIFNLYG